MPKVWMFIDGYNIYYSMKEHHIKSQLANQEPKIHLGWCDFEALATSYMLKPFGQGYTLEKILYFTAPVTNKTEMSRGEKARQSLWLRAIRTMELVDVHSGKHFRDPLRIRKEKMTDVNIAVEMLLGSISGYDAAILLSNDNDLAPPVKAVLEGRSGTKREVHIWTYKWDKRAWALDELDPTKKHVITESMLAQCRLPDVKGMPLEWKAPNDAK